MMDTEKFLSSHGWDADIEKVEMVTVKSERGNTYVINGEIYRKEEAHDDRKYR